MQSSKWHAVIGAVLAVCLAGWPAGACAGGAAASNPKVDHLGEAIVRSTGDQLEVTVDYRFAELSVDQRWIILKAAVTSLNVASTEIPRSALVLITPTGESVALPKYREFLEAYPELQFQIRRAASATRPIEFTESYQQPCGLGFFPLPQTGVAWDSVSVNHYRLCAGFLYFPVPGGVRAGRYELRVKNGGETVTVPFTIGGSSS